MTITATDFSSAGRVLFAIGGGAAIACGAHILGEMTGKWIAKQAKKWKYDVLELDSGLTGAVAGSVLVACRLPKNTPLLIAMMLTSILLTTLTVKKVSLCAQLGIPYSTPKAVFFSGLIALAGARYISPAWGTFLGLAAAVQLSSSRTT